VNIGATAFGPIAHLYVREGDRVKKGEVLAFVENVPQKSAMGAQKATIASIEKDIAANLAAEKAAEATIQNAEADLEQKTLDYKRAQELYKSALISRQDFDARRAAYNVAVAVLAQDKATLAQTNAQTASSRAKLASAQQTLLGDHDAYSKSISVAPFDGIVTNLPVRQGETVVEGIQNAQGSTIMTLANMAVVTAEVKVDETDIIGVKIGQVANVTVDALPGEVFKGHVTEVGDQALLRSTGLSTSQSTTGSEEAKDFKVVVTLDHPLPELRPGMSATANIITAHKDGVIAVPLQALAMGNPEKDTDKRAQKLNASLETGPAAKKPKLVQGVFVLRKDGRKLRAVFVPVETGITGTSDIEVTQGVKPGDEIVTGPYRILRNLKSDAVVQRDTSLPETETAG
jgi:HlyD family secretion protein